MQVNAKKSADLQGSSSSGGGEMTALQKHAAFFDLNSDGVITPWESWQAFRLLGYGYILSTIGVFFTHLFMSYASQDTWIPRNFNININNIQRCKHGSDSQVYRNDGEFSTEAFDSTWNKYDPHGKGHIDAWQLVKMLNRNRDVFDFFGWIAAAFEWAFLWILCADKDWRLHKDVVRGQYDGSLFEKIAERNKRQHRSVKAGSSHSRSVAGQKKQA